MRILVISEGNNELGSSEGQRKLGLVEEDRVKGALIRLVERVLSPRFPPQSKNSIEWRDIRKMGGITKNDWGTGGAEYQRKAMSWIRKAQNEQFDALVVVVDQDNAPGRRNGLEAAQADNRLTLPRAIGLAVKSFDAWMLADERAISNAVGRTVQTQKTPEDHDSKAAMRMIVDERMSVDESDTMTDIYQRIAEYADIDTLCKRCPKGFQPFHCRLFALVSSVS